ncbi:MAG: TPM domain-containing protein [Nitrospiraceae bacterium]
MFSEHDMAKIRDAVQTAEQRTRGEIVPMIVPASARYRESWHLAGLLSALLVLTLLLAVEFGWSPWGWTDHHPGWILVGVVGAYLLGSAIGTRAWCIRLLTPNERMAMKVRRRAEWAFYAHGLHRTREGTGILIMLSLLERRAQVLADRAIHERVPPGTWDELVTELLQGIHTGQSIPAMCRAIARCADLLAIHFPPSDKDNPNELPDDLIRGP